MARPFSVAYNFRNNFIVSKNKLRAYSEIWSKSKVG